MAEPESAFRQLFANWSSRPSNSANPKPTLAEWTDYVKSGANDLYNQLPTYNSSAEQATHEPSWFKLSRMEKMIGFGACLSASILCFIICIFTFPVLALKPRKFALLWTMGSLLFVVLFGVLQGPYSYVKHLLSPSRVVFTLVFFGLVFLTLYCAGVLKSTVLTILACIVELFAVLYYCISYFPFGALTMTFFSSYVIGWVGGFIGGIL